MSGLFYRRHGGTSCTGDTNQGVTERRKIWDVVSQIVLWVSLSILKGCGEHDRMSPPFNLKRELLIEPSSKLVLNCAFKLRLSMQENGC